jgi:hypothetical protein
MPVAAGVATELNSNERNSFMEMNLTGLSRPDGKSCPWAMIVLSVFCGFAGSATAQLDEVFVNPVGVDFGEIKVGDEVVIPVTVTNDSSVAVSLAGGGISDDGFSSTTGCGADVAANSSCQIFYRFVPEARTGYSGSTSLSLSAAGTTRIVSIDLRGAGVESLADMYPVGIDFGPQSVGIQVAVPVTLFNSHDSALGGFAGGGISGAFSGSQNCASGVASGATCAFTYRFTAPSVGDFNGDTSLSFSSDGIAQPVSISLAGSGISGSQLARVTPVSIDFGTIKRGKTTTVPVVLENVTAGTLQNFVGGGVSAPFSGFQNCAGGVPSGSSCTFTYRFTPDSEVEAVGTTAISFSSTTGGSQSVSIELRGRATGTLARVSPVSIDFGEVRTGDSFALPVTVFNDSLSTLSAFSGGGVSDPSFTATTSCGSPTPVGGFCQFIYTFTPVASGPIEAQTSFTFSNDSGLSESISVELDGFGDDSLFEDRFEMP